MQCTPPYIVVIDDDPVFGRLVESIGRSEGLSVLYCESLDSLNHHAQIVAPAHPQSADRAQDKAEIDIGVLVIDFHLGMTTGLALGFEWERRLPQVPIILISQGQDAFRERAWPESVKGFVDKKLGPTAIIETAFAAYRAYGPRISKHSPLNDLIPV